MDEEKRNHLVQLLGAAMSDISEDCYCAGWLVGTEDFVPELCRRAIAFNQSQPWGHGEVTPAKAKQLWTLAELAGSWADLHAQDDVYVAYQPFPASEVVIEALGREK